MAVFKTGEEKRRSYDLRKHYLEHNRGLLGSIYICSQCWAVMSHNELEVDHIFPNSKWYAPNRVFNAVAICPSCNKKKTNKVTFKLQSKAIIAKLLEEFYIFVQKLVVSILRLVIMLFFYLTRLMWSGLMSGSPVRVITSGACVFLIGKYIVNIFM